MREVRRVARSFDGPALSLLLLGSLLLCVAAASRTAFAEPKPNADAENKPSPFGQRIVLQGAATPMFERDLKSVLQECQRKAVEDGVDAILVVEIHNGPSSFGHVWGIGRLLTSNDFGRVRTVAWIPEGEDVTGNNAILALACHDIIMHPESSLGDIGRGKTADDEVQAYVKRLVELRRNPKLNWALAQGMMEPKDVAVKKVTVIESRNGVRTPEVRIVTDERLKELREEKAEIPDVPMTIKDFGEIGTFSGTKANADGILIVRTAKTLEELASVYGVPPKLLHKSVASSNEKKNVALIRVKETITPLLESFLLRQIDRCEKAEKNLIIFEITSPGGYLSSTFNIANRIADLDPDQVRTVAYIPRQALSGAAIIALACDEIYLRPDALIGDAGPIEMREGQQFERAPEKVLSALQGKLRALAEKKHRPPALLEAMANKDLLVYRVHHRDDPGRITYMSDAELKAAGDQWVKGPVVPESEEDKLLTLTGTRAVQLQLATGVIEGKTEKDQMRALKANLGLPPDMKLVAMERTWVDTLVFWLNNGVVTVLLFVIGLVCIYLELNMTSGIFGIIAALCFSLFFWSRFLGGTAGWLEVVLFLLGLALIAIEIFLIPGFGVFGISGGILVLSSLILASQTFGNLEPSADMHFLARTMGELAITIVLVVAIAATISRFLPHVPVLNRLVLSPPGHAETVAELDPQLRPEYVDENAELIGQRGTALSTLRPAGKARVGGRIVDVVSNGPYIREDSAIEVVSVAGNRIVVRGV